MRLGVIGDTHGLLRPWALEQLAGCELILHAGDVGGVEVLDGLRDIAPVIAVRGNTDRGPWASALPVVEAVEIGGLWFYLIHDLNELDIDPAAAGFQVVIHGHSHCPASTRRKGVLYFNPGSAGPRRFKLPIALGVIDIAGGEANPKLIEFAQAA